MPPKKKTSEDAEPRAQPSEDEAAEDKETELNVKPPLKSHPPTVVMVKEALKVLDSRKGVTSQAIRNYIKKTYPTVDAHKLTYLVRHALTKLGPNEVVHLENPKPSGVKKYRLVPSGKGAKQKSENTDPNVQEKAKPPKEGAKKSSKEGGKSTKKSPASEKKQPQEEPKPEKRPKKDEAAKTLETTETKKPSRKKEAEKSPSAKPRTVKAPKVPKAAGLTKSKAARNSPPAAKPGRAKKSAQ